MLLFYNEYQLYLLTLYGVCYRVYYMLKRLVDMSDKNFLVTIYNDIMCDTCFSIYVLRIQCNKK